MQPDLHRQRSAFATTRWSVVLAAGHDSSPEGDSALEALCATYWYPLYAYVRRRGHDAEEAADLTQEFFARLLEKEYLRAADRERGRFRSFLLTVFKRFLSTEHERRQAQKRGGSLHRFSIDVVAGEQRYRFEPTDDWSPDKLYERRWALTLLSEVMSRLEAEYAAKDKARLFAQCKVYLTGEAGAPASAEIARQLELSESAVRVAVHRMRKRYRDLLKQEVAQTVDDPQAVDDELHCLRSALRGETR